MRLATWNINGMNARMEFIKLWLQDKQPDVVGLQELKMIDDKFPTDAFAEIGYHSATHGQKAWNGVAILSKEPAEVLQRGLPGQEDFGARLITARVAGITFTTVYCPNGKNTTHDDFPAKLAWFDQLRHHLAEHHDPATPALLCGDFNIVPQPIDSWSEDKLGGRIFHTESERQRYQALLEFGLHDLFRELYPEEPGFSWWDYRGGAFHKKQGLRIDALLATTPLRERLSEVVADRHWRKKQEGITASDHAPVYADFDA